MSGLKKVPNSPEVVDDKDLDVQSEQKKSLDKDFDVLLKEEKEGKLTFHMPEEFYEPNKKINKIKIINIHDEVKIIEGAALRNFHTDDIKGLIEDSEDVKKVVVEQVTTNDAKRMSLFYDSNDTVDDSYEKAVVAPGELIGVPKEIPRVTKGKNKPKQLSNNTQNDVLRLEGSHSDFYKRMEQKLNRFFIENKHYEQKSNHHHLFEDDLEELLSKDEFIDEDINHLTHSLMDSFGAEEINTLDAEPGFAEPELKSAEDIDISKIENNQSIIERKSEDAVYRRQTLIRKVKKSKPNDFYYKAKNHKDLFKVGNSYFDDVKAGLKSFCFTSINAKTEQEKTIFGISAFFNYHSELNVTIITDSIKDSYYLEHITQPERKTRKVLDEDIHLEFYYVDGITIIEMNELKSVGNSLQKYTFSEFLEDIIKVSDLVLWDLPHIKDMDIDKETYFPITMLVENVSIIVQPENTKLNDIEHMLEYYSKYSIDVKGMILGNRPKSKRVE